MASAFECGSTYHLLLLWPMISSISLLIYSGCILWSRFRAFHITTLVSTLWLLLLKIAVSIPTIGVLVVIHRKNYLKIVNICIKNTLGRKNRYRNVHMYLRILKCMSINIEKYKYPILIYVLRIFKWKLLLWITLQDTRTWEHNNRCKLINKEKYIYLEHRKVNGQQHLSRRIRHCHFITRHSNRQIPKKQCEPHMTTILYNLVWTYKTYSSSTNRLLLHHRYTRWATEYPPSFTST